jgi:hypothetical protein
MLLPSTRRLLRAGVVPEVDGCVLGIGEGVGDGMKPRSAKDCRVCAAAALAERGPPALLVPAALGPNGVHWGT